MITKTEVADFSLSDIYQSVTIDELTHCAWVSYTEVVWINQESNLMK